MRNQGHPAGSWYAATAESFPEQPPLDGEVRADVCVVGAGYTGLGAALELASRGVRVVVLEAARVGSGASGRNGGQIHTGQRREQPWLEARLGHDDARALWRLSEDARDHLHRLITSRRIDCDLRDGLIHARHRPGGEADDAAFINHMRTVYGCERYSLLDDQALSEALGTDVYHGGMVRSSWRWGWRAPLSPRGRLSMSSPGLRPGAGQPAASSSTRREAMWSATS
jgi:gamma-glutamylputrescine oxidase